MPFPSATGGDAAALVETGQGRRPGVANLAPARGAPQRPSRSVIGIDTGVNMNQYGLSTEGFVTNRLWNYIEAEKLVPGDRLLAERELAEHLSLPRSALRRMLAELEAAGMIVREVGRGTFVAGSASPGAARRRVSAASSLDRLANTNPAEVFQARLVIEPQLAHMAAQTATPDQMREMAEAIERGRQAQSLAEFEHWDAEFHHVVARAARNELLLAVYDLISSVRAGSLWGKLKEQSLTPSRISEYISDHEAILLSIRDRDSNNSERHMLRHINTARINMFKSSI